VSLRAGVNPTKVAMLACFAPGHTVVSGTMRTAQPPAGPDASPGSALQAVVVSALSVADAGRCHSG
jgi:hypothetical protein